MRQKRKCQNIVLIKGNIFLKKQRGEISKKNKNKKLTEEQKKHISEGLKGHFSPLKGKNITEEHKRKLKEAAKRKNFHHSEETKKKISEIQKRRWENERKSKQN